MPFTPAIESVRLSARAVEVRRAAPRRSIRAAEVTRAALRRRRRGAVEVLQIVLSFIPLPDTCTLRVGDGRGNGLNGLVHVGTGRILTQGASTIPCKQGASTAAEALLLVPASQ